MAKPLMLAKIDSLLENGRKEITTKKQLEKYPIGSIISYINIEGVFRNGGFITGFRDEYFVYITPDFTTKYRGRYNHITKMYVGTVYTTKNDLVSIVPATNKKSNFPVVVNGINIYFALTCFDAKRYRHTNKYMLMMDWCDYFEPPYNNKK